MRHRMQKRKLGMKTAHRIAVMRNMVTSLLEHGQIRITLQRAKELRKLADHMVTLAKNGSLHARRQALSVVRKKEVVDKLFFHWGPLFAAKNGGYSRIIKLGQRKGDAAEMTIIEMATESLEKSTAKKKPEKKGVEATATVIPQAAEVLSSVDEPVETITTSAKDDSAIALEQDNAETSDSTQTDVKKSEEDDAVKKEAGSN